MNLVYAQKFQKSYEFSPTGWFLVHSGDRLSVNLIVPRFSGPAWKKLVTAIPSPNERVDLITSTVSDPDELEMLGHLAGNDAQIFIDVIDEGSVHILVLIASH